MNVAVTLRKTLPIILGSGILIGCSGEQMANWRWDWWNKDSGSTTRTVKSQDPGKSSTAAARPPIGRPPADSPPADDPNAKEVDEKVERYVRNMNAAYDPDYESNDFTTKIRRQRDPERAGRIQRTAARSRDQSRGFEGDEFESDVSERPSPRPSEPPPEAIASPSTSPDARSSEPVAGEADGSAAARFNDPDAGLEARPAPLPTFGSGSSGVPVSTLEAGNEPAATPAAGEPPPVSSAGRAEPRRIDEPSPTAGTGSPPDRGESSPAEGPVPTYEPSPLPAAPDTTRPREDAGIDAARAERPPVIRDLKISAAEAAASDAPLKDSDQAARIEVVDTFRKRLADQESLVAKDPNNVEEQFRLRLMYLVDGQDEKALAPTAGMDGEVLEIMQAQIRALLAARSTARRDPAAWANRQLEAVEALRSAVRSRADLRIPKMLLCRRIERFGDYESIELPEYPAGQKNQVLLYVEVDNFRSDKTESGNYRTLLSVRSSLLNKIGEELWSQQDENIEEIRKRPLRDFFLAVGPHTLPKNLPPGEYVVKVEVEDVLARKVCGSSLSIRIVP